MKDKVIIIYHANCPDGFSAAWAAWKKFGKRAKYIPQEHHAPPPEGLENADVYILDFSFSKEITECIIKRAKSLTVIDHHITAKAVVESLDSYSFAINNSGAVLSWKYFHPKKKVPKLLLHVEDVDIWKFKLTNTKEITSAMSLYKMDFKAWSKLAKSLENSKTAKMIIEAGRAIIGFKNKIIEEIIDSAELVEFEGYKMLLASSPTTIHSELGNALVKKMPPLGIVYRRKGDSLKISLRSDGTVDVSKIAQKYGGGGHKAAAGFQIGAGEPKPWNNIKNK